MLNMLCQCFPGCFPSSKGQVQEAPLCEDWLLWGPLMNLNVRESAAASRLSCFRSRSDVEGQNPAWDLVVGVAEELL